MREGDLQMRPFVSADEQALESLFGQPEIKRWWPVGDYQRESGWVIEVDDAVAGWLEHHEESYEWFPSVAFDIALDSSLHGRGYGRRALGLAIAHFRSRGHHRFTVDPNVENERAIRCYAAVGFEPVGVLRAYERNPVGGWNDAVLMDLIVDSDTAPSPVRSTDEATILVLQHADCEPPGVYEDEMRERGIPIHRVLVCDGGELPDWHDFAGIVAMGGAMGSYEDEAYPWLAAERRLIGEAVRAGKPYWGVCLGAQLLAASLGATVSPGPAPEVGVLPVHLTAAATEDPVFAGMPATFSTLQWHGDTYELPEGAVRLAGSELYEQQAYVLGSAYALQFHLEVDSKLAAQWMAIPQYMQELEALGGADTPAALLAQVRAVEAESVPLARQLFSRWLIDVVGLPGG
jgi:GMP synthase (glutamine-hydrolysing)